MDQVIYKVSATYIQFKIAELEGLIHPFQSNGLIPNKEIEATQGGGSTFANYYSEKPLSSRNSCPVLSQRHA